MCLHCAAKRLKPSVAAKRCTCCLWLICLILPARACGNRISGWLGAMYEANPHAGRPPCGHCPPQAAQSRRACRAEPLQEGCLTARKTQMVSTSQDEFHIHVPQWCTVSTILYIDMLLAHKRECNELPALCQGLGASPLATPHPAVPSDIGNRYVSAAS